MTRQNSDRALSAADEADAMRWQYVDRVWFASLERFAKNHPIKSIHILPQSDVDYRVFVFWGTLQQQRQAQRDGVNDQIADFIVNAFSDASGGKALTVDFEFDSDENVMINWAGDYQARLNATPDL